MIAPLLYIAFTGLGVYVGVVSLYLVLLTLAACFPSHRKRPSSFGDKTFAVIIPAHDEANGIAETVASVLVCDYPHDKFCVWVIADNCTDNTAEKAAKGGAQVAVRNDPDHRGKGQALDWFLHTYADMLRSYDILVFLDADVRIDADFFQHLVAAFESSSCNAVQSYNGVSNPGENWRTALTFAGFAGVNHLRPLGQDKLFGGTLLKGTGMAFRADVLLEHGWPARSIVEDIEMTLQLAGDGIAVHYCPWARMTSRAEGSAYKAHSQRRRWEGGRFQIMAHYAPQFLLLTLRKPRLLSLGLLLEILTPPLSLLVVLDMLLWVMALACGGSWPWIVALGCCASTTLYVLAALCLVRAPRKVWTALLLAPIFVMWKLLVYFGLILHREKDWVRTNRATRDRDTVPGEHHDKQDVDHGPAV